MHLGIFNFWLPDLLGDMPKIHHEMDTLKLIAAIKNIFKASCGAGSHTRV
jgi:hypothetical protein